MPRFPVHSVQYRSHQPTARMILRPTRFWVESSLDQRQRLQKTLFPNGIDFDGEEFGTDSTSLFFSLIEHDPHDNWGLASLSTQSLNQFAANLTDAESLSAEIASIFISLKGIATAKVRPPCQPNSEEADGQRPKKGHSIRLSVYEPIGAATRDLTVQRTGRRGRTHVNVLCALRPRTKGSPAFEERLRTCAHFRGRLAVPAAKLWDEIAMFQHQSASRFRIGKLANKSENR